MHISFTKSELTFEFDVWFVCTDNTTMENITICRAHSQTQGNEMDRTKQKKKNKIKPETFYGKGNDFQRRLGPFHSRHIQETIESATTTRVCSMSVCVYCVCMCVCAVCAWADMCFSNSFFFLLSFPHKMNSRMKQ